MGRAKRNPSVGAEKGKNDVSLPLTIYLSVAMSTFYLRPNRGEFTSDRNSSDPFKSVIHDILDIVLTRHYNDLIGGVL